MLQARASVFGPEPPGRVGEGKPSSSFSFGGGLGEKWREEGTKGSRLGCDYEPGFGHHCLPKGLILLMAADVVASAAGAVRGHARQEA